MKLSPKQEPYSSEIEDLLAPYPRVNGYLLTLFRVFASSTRFMKKGVQNFLDKESPITLRTREIVILRVCSHYNCEYEWGVHITGFRKAANFSDEQIYALRHEGHTSQCWSQQESVLIQAIDQLCDKACIEGDVYQVFQTIFDHAQQLEIIALCGNYHMVCCVANTAKLESEAFAEKFPPKHL